MNYLDFNCPRITSRLISLGFYKSPISYREDGLEVTTLTPLLPFRALEDGGLYIPVLEEPPLVSRKNDWAKQLSLHWLIMTEFSKQSKELVLYGAIKIEDKLWEEYAEKCDIGKKLLIKVKDGWLQDGDNAPKFLKKEGSNLYTLGEAHSKELHVLIEQGQIRLKQSERGKASVRRRANI